MSNTETDIPNNVIQLFPEGQSTRRETEVRHPQPLHSAAGQIATNAQFDTVHQVSPHDIDKLQRDDPSLYIRSIAPAEDEMYGF